MNNQHEIAMVRHACGKAIHSQAKNANYYRPYAKEADAWATKALVKGRNTERKDAMRMVRKDNAVEVFVCLLAVAFFLILATISPEQPVAIISYIGAGLLGVIGVAYTWKEQRYRKTYRKHLDEQFRHIYKRAKSMDGVNYYGTITNDEIREMLKTQHIMAYPSVYEETSCLTMIEACSAGCLCVIPNLGALPETGANFPWM